MPHMTSYSNTIFDFWYRRHEPHKFPEESIIRKIFVPHTMRKPFLVHLVQESELILACQADVAVNGAAFAAKHTAVA